MIVVHRKILFIIERRIARDEVLDAPVSADTEGNTRAIPIIEERVVVTKRLVLVEEVVADREIKIQMKGNRNG
jgi:stress response protein YsnF